MDFGKFKAQRDDPEFQKAFIDEDRSMLIEWCKRREAREILWCRVRRSIPMAVLAALLVLAIIQIFVKDGCRLPLQSAAIIVELLIVTSLNLVYKAREKWEKPKYSLPPKVFMLAEYYRLGLNIHYSQWISALLGAAIVCLALYFAPVLSTGARMFGWAAAGAAILGVQKYYRREFFYMRLEQTDILADMDNLLHHKEPRHGSSQRKGTRYSLAEQLEELEELERLEKLEKE